MRKGNNPTTQKEIDYDILESKINYQRQASQNRTV